MLDERLNRRRPWPWMAAGLAFALVTAVAPPAEGVPLANQDCPVLPHEPAESEFVTVYKGRTIHFCCSTCVADFKKDPRRYLGRLPQFAGLADEEAAQHLELGTASTTSSTGEEEFEKRKAPTDRALARAWPAMAVALPVFAVWQYLRRKQRRFLTLFFWQFAVLAAGSFALVALLAFREARTDTLLWVERDRVHFATYYDFGTPPIPVRPDVPKRIEARYYRGNDERNAKLFNNGHYRTATFHLSIVDESGRRVAVGDTVAGRRLFVRWEIERAPFTPDRFFTPHAMSYILLTKRSDPFLGALVPVPDKVHPRAVVPMQRWESLYPVEELPETAPSTVDINRASTEELGAVPGVGSVAARWLVKFREFNGKIATSADIDRAGIEGPARRALSALLNDDIVEGIVYVGEVILRKNGDGVAGVRFHYGIKYELHVRDGKLGDGSDLWMNYLYRTRKVARSAIPDEQWFSSEPIPELPAKGTDDEMLLGLDELDPRKL